MGIKSGETVTLLGAPDDFDATLGELPNDVRVKRQARGAADRVLLFARSLAELRRRFAAAERLLGERGALWICWPKKASGVATDIAEPDVRAFGLAAGWVDYKVCAVDATWSGLLFARRKA
ncbi:MAG TPA: DUF3052 domain-containing protein [Thermoanaerobaculia bacterium]